MIIRDMTHNECIALIGAERLARLACARDHVPYVVPIHYAYARNRLYGFSMPGKKLDMLRENPYACLQIEEYRDPRHWRSVVVDTLFEELPDAEETHEERLHAWSLLEKHFDWWEPGALKPKPQPLQAVSSHVFFALEIVALSGREAIAGDPVASY